MKIISDALYEKLVNKLEESNLFDEETSEFISECDELVELRQAKEAVLVDSRFNYLKRKDVGIYEAEE